jgi:MYXO-CTERM domain-containing protein
MTMNRLATRARLTLLPLIALGVLLAAPRAAHASPEFPGVMMAHLSLPGGPPCSMCHAGNVTSLDTVFTPFGRALRLNGLVVEDDTSLIAALDALDANGIDSDHDGVSDIDELTLGTDPNIPPTDVPPEPWHLGCSVAPGSGSLPAPYALAFLSLTGAIFVRAWRRKRSRSAAPRG